MALMTGARGEVRVTPDQRLRAPAAGLTGEALFRRAHELLELLAGAPD